MPPTTRDLLLEAAISVIESDGERAVKVRDIALRAGVTEPSLYHFFGDRNGLIEAAQAIRFGRDQREVLQAFLDDMMRCRTRAGFVRTVRSHLTRALDPSGSHRRMTRVNALGSAQSRPALAAQLAMQQRATNKLFGDGLRLAQAKGFIRPNVDCDALAAWIVGASTGRVLIELDDEVVDAHAWNRIAIDAMLSATGNPPASLTRWEHLT